MKTQHGATKYDFAKFVVKYVTGLILIIGYVIALYNNNSIAWGMLYGLIILAAVAFGASLVIVIIVKLFPVMLKMGAMQNDGLKATANAARIATQVSNQTLKALPEPEQYNYEQPGIITDGVVLEEGTLRND